MSRSRVIPAAPALAKFSRPRLYNVHKRERLFKRLDEARAHPIVWIAGPPGAGKSTLVASYIEARRIAGIWFQADVNDADPATFFHYITLAASEFAGARSKGVAALPRFGPEYTNDLPAFTRRYLRAFFALLPQGSIAVVDNFHEAPANPAWRFAFSEGMREVPVGMNLIFLSRTPPLPEMARLIADQTITRIDADELRLTPEEATAMVGDAPIEPAMIQAMHRASDGWAAGIVLMREHLSHHGDKAVGEALLPVGKEAVFAYFTGEIFGRAKPNNQRTLMLAALLPSITAGDAETISGDPDAPRVLDYLYRHHLFTDRRRAGGDPVYQFHALFREFLLDAGRAKLTAEDRRDALDRAAGQLVGRGDFDAAAALYAEAQAWPALVGLSLHAGASWLAEGRGSTLAKWIAALPDDTRQREPRLSLYLGVALLYADPPRAKALLNAAYEGFVQNGDLRRQLMTAAHAVDCHYFEWADFAPLDRWIGVFEAKLDDNPPFNAPYDALRVYSSFLIALLFRQPEHPRIGEVAREVQRLIDAPEVETVPLNQRINAASILFNYYNWKTKGDTADALIARVAPWLENPQATPLNRVWWRVHLAFNHQILSRFGRAKRTMDEAEAIAREHGLRSVLFELYYAEISPIVATQDVNAAVAALEKLRTVLNPARRMDLSYFRFQESTVRLLQGRTREAVHAATEALRIGREAGLPGMQVPHFLVRLALCHLQQDEIAQAIALYEEAIECSAGIDRKNFQAQLLLVRAYQAHCAGQTAQALQFLRDVLPRCREQGYRGFLRQSPGVAAPLFALALEHDIETTYVQDLIRQRQLAPPSFNVSSWPWPLAVLTLGELSIVRDGTPLVSKGKAQKKPLELLKALIAHGGRNVDAAMLTALLWPDAEGDDAKTSLDSNVYRLRKLLGVDGALTLAEGKLSLNPACVFVDTWAFERALDSDPPDVAAALKLYRGHFLALESATPWALPLRDRLQSRLIRAVVTDGMQHERRGEWATARALYERALDIDNLAETIYQRLMVCQRELGDPAAALTTYRRCRELLSIVLGRKPNTETEAVRATLN